MNYHYKGKAYRLELSSTGQIVCGDLDISRPTVEAVEAEIRRQVDAEKNVAPVPVYIFPDRYRQDYIEFIEAKARPVNVGNTNYVEFWVSWKGERDHQKRAKLSATGVYLGTPENKAILETILDISQQVTTLESERSRLLKSLTRLSPTKGE